MKKEIELIEKQIELLKSRKFELSSWKMSVTMVLSRIFGNNSDKIRLIQALDYDYSSWNLRDDSGEADPIIQKAQKILEVCIDELRILGVPEKENRENKQEPLPNTILEDILEIIGDEIKGSQLRALKELLAENKSGDNDSNKGILSQMKEIDNESLAVILTNILTKYNR